MLGVYLTIKLLAFNFYDEVIVNESEARVNYPFIEIESEKYNCLSKNKLEQVRYISSVFAILCE